MDDNGNTSNIVHSRSCERVAGYVFFYFLLLCVFWIGCQIKNFQDAMQMIHKLTKAPWPVALYDHLWHSVLTLFFLPNSETISILLAHSLLRLCFAAFAFSFPLLCLHSPEGPRKKNISKAIKAYCCEDPEPKVGRQPPPYINTNRTWEDSSLQRLWLTACLHATVTQTAVKHNATSIGQQVPA